MHVVDTADAPDDLCERDGGSSSAADHSPSADRLKRLPAHDPGAEFMEHSCYPLRLADCAGQLRDRQWRRRISAGIGCRGHERYAVRQHQASVGPRFPDVSVGPLVLAWWDLSV